MLVEELSRETALAESGGYESLLVTTKGKVGSSRSTGRKP